MTGKNMSEIFLGINEHIKFFWSNDFNASKLINEFCHNMYHQLNRQTVQLSKEMIAALSTTIAGRGSEDKLMITIAQAEIKLPRHICSGGQQLNAFLNKTTLSQILIITLGKSIHENNKVL